MRWFGWGQEGSSTMELPEAAGRLLGQRLGVAERHTPLAERTDRRHGVPEPVEQLTDPSARRDRD